MGNRLCIREDRCRGCEICIEMCPIKALSQSDQLSARGVHPPRVNLEKCTYCGYCELSCPDLAIVVVKETK